MKWIVIAAIAVLFVSNIVGAYRNNDQTPNCYWARNGQKVCE